MTVAPAAGLFTLIMAFIWLGATVWLRFTMIMLGGGGSSASNEGGTNCAPHVFTLNAGPSPITAESSVLTWIK